MPLSRYAVKLEIWVFFLAVGCSSVAVGDLDAIALPIPINRLSAG
jgi:hypothetical protein